MAVVLTHTVGIQTSGFFDYQGNNSLHVSSIYRTKLLLRNPTNTIIDNLGFNPWIWGKHTYSFQSKYSKRISHLILLQIFNWFSETLFILFHTFSCVEYCKNNTAHSFFPIFIPTNNSFFSQNIISRLSVDIVYQLISTFLHDLKADFHRQP